MCNMKAAARWQHVECSRYDFSVTATSCDVAKRLASEAKV